MCKGLELTEQRICILVLLIVLRSVPSMLTALSGLSANESEKIFAKAFLVIMYHICTYLSKCKLKQPYLFKIFKGTQLMLSPATTSYIL